MRFPSDRNPQQETRTYAVPFNVAAVMSLQTISEAKQLTIQQSLYWALEVSTYLLTVQENGGQVLIVNDEGETSAIEV